MKIVKPDPIVQREAPPVIRFYSSRMSYYEFSNFYLRQFVLDEKLWPSVENYFQAQKFNDESYNERIRNSTPSQAKKLGRARSLPIRPDWENVKENFMYAALHAKFTQNPDLKALLLSTGEATLEEDSPRDMYWGRRGHNRLGILLMTLRYNLSIEPS